MMEFYRQLNACRSWYRTAALTVLDGPSAGEKALFTKGALQWESRQNGFFSHFSAEASVPDSAGIFTACGSRIFCEFPAGDPRLILCGGGHVSIAVIRIARMAGFSITVLEDRSSFAENARAAGAGHVICAPFEEGLSQIPGGPDAFFVVVTRGHQYDEICLRLIAEKEYAYAGMMGSRSRAEKIREHLRKSGADPRFLAELHSPIGLPIQAETPEEIAVSILAEIILEKNKARRGGGLTREILQAILKEEDPAEKKVLATLVARKGSAPRETGTKMLIDQDGHCTGTIGGGRLEAEILRQALQLMESGSSSPLLFRFCLSGQDAAEDGMVCGGSVEVLLEPVSQL